jgi:hypothetical protein
VVSRNRYSVPGRLSIDVGLTCASIEVPSILGTTLESSFRSIHRGSFLCFSLRQDACALSASWVNSISAYLHPPLLDIGLPLPGSRVTVLEYPRETFV